jgi:hypothetical protein
VRRLTLLTVVETIVETGVSSSRKRRNPLVVPSLLWFLTILVILIHALASVVWQPLCRSLKVTLVVVGI